MKLVIAALIATTVLSAAPATAKPIKGHTGNVLVSDPLGSIYTYFFGN